MEMQEEAENSQTQSSKRFEEQPEKLGLTAPEKPLFLGGQTQTAGPGWSLEEQT